MDSQKISNLDSDLFTLWAEIEAAPARLRSQRTKAAEYGEIPSTPLPQLSTTDARVAEAAAKVLTPIPTREITYSLKPSLLCQKLSPLPPNVPINSIKPSMDKQKAVDLMALLLEADDAQAVIMQMSSQGVSPFWKNKNNVALINLSANSAWQMMVWLACKEPKERWARYVSQLLLSAEESRQTRDDALFRLTTIRQGGVELNWSFDEEKTPLYTLLIIEHRNLFNPPHVKIAFPPEQLTAALLKVPSLEKHLQAYFRGWTAYGKPRFNASKSAPTKVKAWEKIWKRALIDGNLKAAKCLVTNLMFMTEGVVNAWIESPRTNRARWHLLLISAFRAELFFVSDELLMNAVDRGHTSAIYLLASWGAKLQQASNDTEYIAGRNLYQAVGKPPAENSFLIERDGYSSIYSSLIAKWPLTRDELSQLLSCPKTPFLTPNLQGWTALHEVALLAITKDILSLFLIWAESQRGLSFAPIDNRGKTPYKLAVDMGNLWTARELKALQLLPIAPKRSDRS